MIKARDILSLILTFFVYSLSVLFSKMASMQNSQTSFLVFYGISLCCMAVYAILWQFCLKKMPLNVAYSLKSITILFSVLFGIFLFHEGISWKMIAGMALIFTGIYLMGRDIHE